MKSTTLKAVALAGLIYLGCACVLAQDWPQWRGPSRDAKAIGFKAPKVWPKELTRKWQVTVGDGVATPALVGDQLYVFSRQDGEEIIRCLKADSGKEVWADRYKAATISGPARGFPGPRASPTVADGKVVTLGVHGSLACYEADSGKLVWRKDDFKGSVPNFYTSSSPVIFDKLCISQLGGGRGGAIVAHELGTGKEKWKRPGDGTAYASPSVLTVGETKAIVAETANSIVAVNVRDGKELWKTAYKTRYNASTPMTEGDRVIIAGSGKGTKAVKLEAKDGELKATELWSNPAASVIYNTPVIKDGLLYGLSETNRLFCLNMRDGKKAWETTLGGSGRGRGYGSIVDVGPTLMALTPAGELLVFEPSDKEYKQLAKYTVGKSTYAYPVISGNRVFIKDAETVALWLVEE